MEFTHMYGPSPLTTKLLVMFCFTWPYLAFIFIRRRETSPAPITAMLIPLAAGLTEAWLNVASGIQWRTYFEALASLFMGALCAGVVALIALVRRHPPRLDRVSAILVACWIAMTNVLVFGQHTRMLAIAGAVIAGLLAIAAFAWLMLVFRHRVETRFLPFGAPVVALSLFLVLLLTWRRAQHIIDLAR